MNYELRDTPEQDALRESFRSSHLTRNNPTTACPCCMPNHKGKSAYFFERGTCGDLVAMRCNNCGFIRTSKPRQVSQTATPAQQRAIDKIRAHFEAERLRLPNAPAQLKEWSLTPDGRGGFWLRVETGGHILLTTGGHFHIGQRGSVELWSLADVVTGDHKQVRSELMCMCTGAKLSKHF